MYTGQIREYKAHGIGMLSSEDSQYVGDWAEGWFTGHGEAVDNTRGWVYRCEFTESRRMYGYGELAGGDGGRIQGLCVDMAVQGPVRYTAPDGSVKDTIWESGRDLEVPCCADEAVEKAEEGWPSFIYMTSVTIRRIDSW